MHDPKRVKLDSKLGGESLGDKSLVQKFIRYVENGGMDLEEFFRLNVTTPTAPCIGMFIFDETLIKENILRNLNKQKKGFSGVLLKYLCNFFKITFTCINSKVSLEILLRFTKSDMEVGEWKRELALFFTNGAKKFEEGNNIRMASEEEINKIKNYLQYPIILTAIENNIRFFMKEVVHVDMEHVKNLINNMNIYIGNVFPCLPGMRGACLVDGLVIFKAELDGDVETLKDIRDADLATLSIHESIHFILRCFMQDFNMSSPFKDSIIPSKDAVSPSSNLEMGRKIVYDLFGGIRLSWILSPEAATEFLKRIKEPETILPVIRKNEKGLIGKTGVSSSFACDYVPRPNIC